MWPVVSASPVPAIASGSETAAIARGAAAELGNLANTQGQVEVGPLAVKKPQ